jgi:hypothetical protein
MPTRTASTVKRKKPAAKARKVAKKPKGIGRVIHFYDRIGVAIVELASPMKVGDFICIKRGEQELLQAVSSIQIEHLGVSGAKKGDVVGLKVTKAVHEGSLVLPA